MKLHNVHTLTLKTWMTAVVLSLLAAALQARDLAAEAMAEVEAETYADVEFDSTQMYSRLLIDSRLGDFYANTTLMGLPVYDTTGALVQAGGKKLKFDYVPGLVAKAVIEAADFYRDSTFARPWFHSVEDYACTFAASVPTTGGSLDNLNAAKMYCTLYDMTAPDGAFASVADTATHTVARTAMQRAVQGLRDANTTYVIQSSTSEDAAGGWWHKKGYPNQMWCDGQYMGPALLAQLQHYGYHIASDTADWQTIVRQFDITWHYLWDPDQRLLWHAFSADPTGSAASCWADPLTGRSAEYWGRACGWYMLALVDVIDLMPAGIDYRPTQTSLATYSTDARERLGQYLALLAQGLKARQDDATGCWYQLLAHDGTFSASSYGGKTYSETFNYLESSASAIFTAAYLKAIRLGLLPADEYLPMARRAYRGLVEEFVKRKTDGTYTLVNSCASAGLGGSNKRDGSAAYYLLGSDVKRITTYTEGKVFGAFILASVEYERLQQASRPEPSAIRTIAAGADRSPEGRNAGAHASAQGGAQGKGPQTYTLSGVAVQGPVSGLAVDGGRVVGRFFPAVGR